MTLLEAEAKAKKRWGEGDHLFNIGKVFYVGPSFSKIFTKARRKLGPDPFFYGCGLSWNKAFLDYDEKFDDD